MMATNDDRLFSRDITNLCALIRETLIMGHPFSLSQRLNENTMFKELTKFYTLFFEEIRKIGRKGYEYNFTYGQNILRTISTIFYLSTLTTGEIGSYLSLMRTLNNGHIDISNLEKKLDITVSRLTLRKHLNELVDCGMAIKTAGYKDMYALSPDLLEGLNKDDRLGLWKGISTALHMEMLSADLHTALRVLELSCDDLVTADLHIQFKHILFHHLADEINIWLFVEALREKRSVKMVYSSKNFENGQTSYSEIFPLEITYDVQLGRSYFYGFYPKTNETLVFRADRIISMELNAKKDEEESTYDSSCFHKLREECLWNSALNGESYKVSIHFDRTGVNEYRVYNERRGGKVTNLSKDIMLYEVNVLNYFEIKPWILSFGSSCEVIEPIDLRAEMIKTFKEMSGE